jgi:hypothetical protein
LGRFFGILAQSICRCRRPIPVVSQSEDGSIKGHWLDRANRDHGGSYAPEHIAEAKAVTR